MLLTIGAVGQTTPTEIAVSLKTPDGKYVGQVANGGLDASSATATAKQNFVLVDINGGKVADGDSVRLRYDASEWHEDAANKLIHRVPTRAGKPEECIFKIRVKDKLIVLETPSGKFVKVADGAVVTTDDKKDATPFDVQAAAPVASPTQYTVAFKFASGNLLGMVAGGGLDASAKEVTANQVFTMIDLNGGNLANGDAVKLLFGGSQLREDSAAGKIHRVPIKGATESECIFKIFVVGANVLLQAPGGKYIAASADFKSIVTTEKKDASSLLTAVPNPAVK